MLVIVCANVALADHWTEAEDEKLKSLVEKIGSKWPLISTELQKQDVHRTCKQCRERWLEQLNPNIAKTMYDDNEIEIIITHRQKKIGWSGICDMLNAYRQKHGLVGVRTPNRIKNWTKSSIYKIKVQSGEFGNKRKREDNIKYELIKKRRKKHIVKAAEVKLRNAEVWENNSDAFEQFDFQAYQYLIIDSLHNFNFLEIAERDSEIFYRNISFFDEL